MSVTINLNSQYSKTNMLELTQKTWLSKTIFNTFAFLCSIKFMYLVIFVSFLLT